MPRYILLKGEITGIQDFIFNIKSKCAARALKARSYYIEMLGWLAEKKAVQTFSEAMSIYNGGGNFYLKIPEQNWDKEQFEILQTAMLQELPRHSNLAIVLSCIEYDDSNSGSYGLRIEQLNRQSAKRKLNRYPAMKDAIKFFEPIAHRKKDDQTPYIEFTDKLARRKYIDIHPSDENTSSITRLFGSQLKLHEEHPKTESARIVYRHIPLWRSDQIQKYKAFTEKLIRTDPDTRRPQIDGIVEFEYLSHFAYARSGTDKLGILKLDIDNLGALFIKLGSRPLKLSTTLYWRGL